MLRALDSTGFVRCTPLLDSPEIDAGTRARVFVKAESLQLTGSFKIRGALNAILGLDVSAIRGVGTYSAGNHGQGVAAAAARVGCPAVVVMPDTAPRIKAERCRWWGAEVVFYDPRTQDRQEVFDRIARDRDLLFIPPFDDHRVMAGQGTVGLEIVGQLDAVDVVPDLVVIPCSGGGLAAGVTEAVRARHPDIEIDLVEPAGMAKMGASLRSGVPEARDPSHTTLMDGIAGPRAGRHTLAVLLRHHVQACTVTDDQAARAVRAAYASLKLVLEPAGAAALAAVLTGVIDGTDKNVVVIASGGNVDAPVFAEILTQTE